MPKKMGSMTIELQNISKLYGSQKALDQINLSINKGEITGLLGPNGAGKSTLMKIISCFLPPTEGKATVYGFDVMENPIEVKSRIGYLPEHNPLYPEMYVREYLQYVAGIYKMKGDLKARIDEIVEMTGLTLEQNKKIGALSKGYRQRVGLAQSLIHNPDVLILDEPTTGLDPNQLVEIRELIKKIGREKTVLLSTHIMQEVEAICDRVLIIHKGKLIADEKTQDLGKLLGKTQSVIVEFDKAPQEAELGKIKGISKVTKTGNCTYQLLAKNEVDFRQELFQWAVKNNIQILSLNKKESKLEEIFHELTK